MRLLWLSLILLTSCESFHTEQTCQVGGLRFRLEKDRPCEYYERVAADAIELLTVTNHWAKPEDFNGVEVWVHDDYPTMLCSVNNLYSAGCYHTGYYYLETVNTAGPLAHELLHHVDFLANRQHRDHRGWGSEGTNLSQVPWPLAENPGTINVGSWWYQTEGFQWKWYETFREEFK